MTQNWPIKHTETNFRFNNGYLKFDKNLRVLLAPKISAEFGIEMTADSVQVQDVIKFLKSLLIGEYIVVDTHKGEQYIICRSYVRYTKELQEVLKEKVAKMKGMYVTDDVRVSVLDIINFMKSKFTDDIKWGKQGEPAESSKYFVLQSMEGDLFICNKQGIRFSRTLQRIMVSRENDNICDSTLPLLLDIPTRSLEIIILFIQYKSDMTKVVVEYIREFNKMGYIPTNDAFHTELVKGVMLMQC